LYFTDRTRGPRPRTNPEIDARCWAGLRRQIEARITDGSFGASFPEACPDGGSAVSGTHEEAFFDALAAEVRELDWPCHHLTDWGTQPRDHPELPSTGAVLDGLEFVHRHVAEPKAGMDHSFFRHQHLSFDRRAGQRRWREDVNRILARNGVAFELTEAGRAERVGPPVLGDRLRSAVFDTGDDELDRLLETARREFFDRDDEAGRAALEHLWDAFERVKTLIHSDKKTGGQHLLAGAADSPEFLKLLEADELALRKAGDRFAIRHADAAQVPVFGRARQEYLFGRLYNLLALLLPRRGASS
jgi:hypothetical protein